VQWQKAQFYCWANAWLVWLFLTQAYLRLNQLHEALQEFKVCVMFFRLSSNVN
jgi:hypothetical protein